uniref:Uncharacterized protein n=1 Tax=Arundo donax TaxID=35708 RepID=A0A0A9DU14_ARUDO
MERKQWGRSVAEGRRWPAVAPPLPLPPPAMERVPPRIAMERKQWGRSVAEARCRPTVAPSRIAMERAPLRDGETRYFSYYFPDLPGDIFHPADWAENKGERNG